VLVATRSERIFGNLGDPRLPKAEDSFKRVNCYGEEPFYKETKRKEAGRESEEIIVPIDGNAT
jgi:hypothetical protein